MLLSVSCIKGLRQNQKFDREFQKLSRVFKKLGRVFVLQHSHAVPIRHGIIGSFIFWDFEWIAMFPVPVTLFTLDARLMAQINASGMF